MVCESAPDVAVMVTVLVCGVALAEPQATMSTIAKANRSTADARKRVRYLRARASSRNPKPNARQTRGAGRAPGAGCNLALAESVKVTVVLRAAPAGVSVEGLKLHAM